MGIFLLVMDAIFPAFLTTLVEGIDDGPEDTDTHDGIGDGKKLAGVGLGAKIAIADSGERDGTEVERVEPTKSFDVMVENGAKPNKDKGKKKNEEEGLIIR